MRGPHAPDELPPKTKNGTKGGRRRRALLALGALLLLSLLGAGAWAGYSYYEYRTFTGNPNVYPSYVKGFGAVRTETFDSPALGKPMKYIVYTPPGYDDPRFASRHYPVVYLLHGSPGTEEDWVTVGGLDEKMDALLAEKQAQPMIVVMPQGNYYRFSPPNAYIDGPNGRWADYITKDLVRNVDSRFRTVRSAKGRALAGLSEGGFGATNLGLKYRREFSVVGSFSGYFRLSPKEVETGGSPQLARANSPALYLPELSGPLPRFYLYTGTRDRSYKADNARFADELKAKGASYELHFYPGGHSWSLWRGRLPGFLVFASKNLKGEG